MNSLDALKTMVRNYPGGMEAVALRLGKSPSTLDKELRNAPGYKMGVLDASALTCLCMEVHAPHALAWLNAEAVNCGVSVVLPEQAAAGGGDVWQLMSLAVAEVSDVTAAVVNGQADGSISPNDRKRIQKEVAEAIDALQQLMRATDAACTMEVCRA